MASTATTDRPRILLPNDRSAYWDIREQRIVHDGNVTLIKTQDAQPMFAAIRARKDIPVERRATMRYVGSIPLLVGQRWARECGFAIGTKGWREYAHGKLRDRDYRKLTGDA